MSQTENGYTEISLKDFYKVLAEFLNKFKIGTTCCELKKKTISESTPVDNTDLEKYNTINELIKNSLKSKCNFDENACIDPFNIFRNFNLENNNNSNIIKEIAKILYNVENDIEINKDYNFKNLTESQNFLFTKEKKTNNQPNNNKIIELWNSFGSVMNLSQLDEQNFINFSTNFKNMISSFEGPYFTALSWFRPDIFDFDTETYLKACYEKAKAIHYFEKNGEKARKSLDSIANAIEYKGNIILQGPPGVGKTFFAKEFLKMKGIKLIGEGEHASNTTDNEKKI